MMLSDFTVLSFDCYGTLIDWETGLRTELQQLIPPDSDLTADDVLDVYGEIENGIQRDQPSLLYPSVITTAVIETGTRLGLPAPADVAERIGFSVPNWPAFPDSAEALARLKQHYALVILSNVDRESFAGSNERLGVEFDAILTAQDIGSYKPDPRNFDVLLEWLDAHGIPRDKHLHVAQGLFHDHVPAKAKGIRTVYIDRKFGQTRTGASPNPGDVPTPDWTFHSMQEFADAALASDA